MKKYLNWKFLSGLIVAIICIFKAYHLQNVYINMIEIKNITGVWYYSTMIAIGIFWASFLMSEGIKDNFGG